MLQYVRFYFQMKVKENYVESLKIRTETSETDFALTQLVCLNC